VRTRYDFTYGVDQEGREYEQFELHDTYGVFKGVTRRYYGTDGQIKDYQYVGLVYETS